jgi:hypothetical protein
MRSCRWIASLVIAFVLSAVSTRADEDGFARLSVFWFPGNLGRQCPIDDAAVAREVRRIFGRMGVYIDWTTVNDGDVEYHGEVIVVGLEANPLPRPSIMGSTNHESMSAWVYCSVIAEALGIRGPKGRDSALLSRSIGRVAAHEITHVLAPALGHSREGLMRARWREAMLRDEDVAADTATRKAVRARLSRTITAARPTPWLRHTSDLTKAEP